MLPAFVDGFFRFLVGAPLVALTENWQRLGSYEEATRTIVLVDEKLVRGSQVVAGGQREVA